MMGRIGKPRLADLLDGQDQVARGVLERCRHTDQRIRTLLRSAPGASEPAASHQHVAIRQTEIGAALEVHRVAGADHQILDESRSM